jgi:hypothetical protein
MGEANIKRSQAILRMPVDMVDAVMFLHDGDRSEVLLFVPPSEDISRLLSDGNAFLPVMREASMCFVARAAIACLGVEPKRAPRLEADFGPAEEQPVKVTLRSGTVLEGTMRWIGTANASRTGDHLNSDGSSFIVVHGTTHAYIIIKSHIAMVREVA